MKVLVLCGDAGIPLYGPSGASAHLRGVARAFVRRGAQVCVATPLPSDHRGTWGTPIAARAVHRPPRTWLRGLRTLGRHRDAQRLYAAATDGFSPDLVWERHSRWDTALAHPLRILEVNAPVLHEGGKARRSTARRVRRSLHRAARVIAVSGWLARWAITAGCDPARVRHVANGVEPRALGDRAATRARLGLSGNVLGFLGSNKPAHGLHRLPAILDALGGSWSALCVGVGPVPAPAHPRLHAVGGVPSADVPDLLAAMDVGIAPYAADAPPWFCPLKVLAYRAAGLPVVAPARGDCVPLVGDAGVAPAGDQPVDWASAVADSLGRGQRWVRPWDAVIDEATAGLW